MDGYAKMMLEDDMSSRDRVEFECPSCHLKMTIKDSDPYVRCLKCGQTFYIERLDEQ